MDSCALEGDEFACLPRLRLRLWVNGELRQDGTAADLITGPAAALSLRAGFQRLEPGDLLLTGTPGGTALRAPPGIVAKVGDLLPTSGQVADVLRPRGRQPRLSQGGRRDHRVDRERGRGTRPRDPAHHCPGRAELSNLRRWPRR